jgi:hypothetical protein
MGTVFFPARKVFAVGVLLKGSKFKQLYLINSLFPDFRKADLSSHRRMPQLTAEVYTMIQCVAMVQKWCQNSRGIIFRDYTTDPIHQT